LDILQRIAPPGLHSSAAIVNKLHRRFSIWAVRALLRFVASTGTTSCRTEEYFGPRRAGRR
jgi:hypothetical protein